jgi:hypothetical protein
MSAFDAESFIKRRQSARSPILSQHRRRPRGNSKLIASNCLPPDCPEREGSLIAGSHRASFTLALVFAR